MQNKKKLITISALVSIVVITIIGIYIYSQRLTYTKEFTYLPEVRGMKVEKYEKPKDSQFGNAIYKIEGKRYKSFLPKYKKFLVKDGWKITKEKSPENLEATKDNHVAKLNVVDSKEGLTILIWTK